MPRISPSLLRQARSIDRLLAQLLPVCRELDAAQNELRWLREHATTTKHDLSSLVHRRARGEPLQYILGTEYFGDLEIACRAGVLIPRQETAASVTCLVRQHLPNKQRLRVLDLCTGTGCIPLLFNHEYHKQASCSLELTAVDISHNALALAEENRQRQIQHTQSEGERQALDSMRLINADILKDDFTSSLKDDYDILISNPPYISAHDLKTTTARSVRLYEPHLALVPQSEDTSVNDGDQFYPRLWQIADKVSARTILFEIGDEQQAHRVAKMGLKHEWDSIELWRDEPMGERVSGACDTVGSGNVRSVFAKRG